VSLPFIFARHRSSAAQPSMFNIVLGGRDDAPPDLDRIHLPSTDLGRQGVMGLKGVGCPGPPAASATSVQGSRDKDKHPPLPARAKRPQKRNIAPRCHAGTATPGSNAAAPPHGYAVGWCLDSRISGSRDPPIPFNARHPGCFAGDLVIPSVVSWLPTRSAHLAVAAVGMMIKL